MSDIRDQESINEPQLPSRKTKKFKKDEFDEGASLSRSLQHDQSNQVKVYV